VRIGGFDKDIMGWTDAVQLEESWQAEDAMGCPGSGSLHIRYPGTAPPGEGAGIFVCAPVQAGVQYNFGAWLKEPAGQPPGQGHVFVAFTTSSNCDIGSTSSTQIGGTSQAYLSQGDVWTHVGGTIEAPPGAQAVEVWVGVNATYQVSADDVFFTPSPGRF
jgi:hypothetical protein